MKTHALLVVSAFFCLFIGIADVKASTERDGRVPELISMAQGGDTESQSTLAGMYYYGIDVPQDYKRSAEWARKAAMHGDLISEDLLGNMYAWGNGVERDYTAAVYWFIKATSHADMPNPAASSMLAWFYYFGDGTPKNDKLAAKHFMISAGAGHEVSQYQLGEMYLNGELDKVNKNKVISWLAEACKKNYKDSCNKVNEVANLN
ncbi:TPA: tetratricopeptide repeat protein [Morganella morganii]